MADHLPQNLEGWNARIAGCFPGAVGMRLTKVEAELVQAEFTVTPALFAPNGFLHAGSVVTLADTCCGVGTIRNIAAGASFTTLNLTSNFLGTAREGEALCEAVPLHIGGSTHVWDAVVKSSASGKVMAQFRCTQMILKPRG